MVGVKKFLVIKGSGIDLDFSTATYIYSDNKISSQKIPTVSSDDLFFATFTGVLMLKHLSTEGTARFVYQNGTTLQRNSQTANSTEYNNRSADAVVCVNYVTCYWSGHCDDGYNTPYGTVTQGIDGCDYPQSDGSCNNYAYWEKTGSHTDRQCHSEPDPPLPGDNGGSTTSGTTTGNPTNPTGRTTTWEIIKDDGSGCPGASVMVQRQSNGPEVAAFRTTNGDLILLPTAGNTGTTVNISFPYRDTQNRIIISSPYQNNIGAWYVDLADYSTGIADIKSYPIEYAIHSHPVGSTFDSDNPSPEDKSNAALYPGMQQLIVNKNNFIIYDKDGVIRKHSNPCP